MKPKPKKFETREARSATFFPSLQRGHKRVKCRVKDCVGAHFQNPLEQARKFWERHDG